MKKMLSVLSFVLASAAVAPLAHAGKIVLANDEWTLSNTGYSGPNDPGTFATNIATWFTGGGAGNFHAYSTNFGLTSSSLSSTMTGAGNTWTTGTGISFDLATLSAYDGIFLSGNAADNNVLIQYVNAGGNVYLAGGTGWGGAAAEAAQWNTFLNAFGLGFGSSYNGVCCNIPISNAHPIFTGVDSLYQNNGNDALDINVLDPNAVVLVSYNTHGLYAIYDSGSTSVPVPATLALFGLGMISLAAVRRKFS